MKLIIMGEENDRILVLFEAQTKRIEHYCEQYDDLPDWDDLYDIDGDMVLDEAEFNRVKHLL